MHYCSEHTSLQGCDTVSLGERFPGVSKDHGFFIFRVKQSKQSSNAWALRQRHCDPSQHYAVTHPMMLCHIPTSLHHAAAISSLLQYFQIITSVKMATIHTGQSMIYQEQGHSREQCNMW